MLFLFKNCAAFKNDYLFRTIIVIIFRGLLTPITFKLQASLDFVKSVGEI